MGEKGATAYSNPVLGFVFHARIIIFRMVT
jgi:hypothetical protein